MSVILDILYQTLSAIKGAEHMRIKDAEHKLRTDLLWNGIYESL